MRTLYIAMGLLFLLLQVGCASYARFPSESSITAAELLKDFGASSGYAVVGPEQLRGNTLKSEAKMFVTDSSVQKRYFAVARDLVYIQDVGMTAYGFITLPTGDAKSKGDVCPFRYIEGVFVIPASQDCYGPEKLIVTSNPIRGDIICWISGIRTAWPGWSKWDCSIERGNTLKAERE